MDLHYEISTILLIFGYSLYILGICSHAWKFETGYDYGLWYRCDRRGCVFYSVDFMDYLNVVRLGIVFCTLFFAISFICLLIEVVMVIARSNSKHKRRLGKTVVVTVILSEIASSAFLGFYGYQNVIRDNKKLPALMWGFACTGFGVIVCFLGTLVRVMGPVSTWHRIPCLKKSNKTRKCIKSKEKREIYRRRDISGPQSKIRPTKINRNQPRDVIVYRSVSQHSKAFSSPGLEDSYENLVVPSHDDLNASSTHHKYEEIVLNNDMLLTQKCQQRLSPASSLRHSPKLPQDLSPKKSSSLPPGISPGFYAKVHRHPRRRENPYEFSPQPQRHYHHPYHQQHQFQTLPYRPVQTLSIDCSSARSSPIPSPPSPPLPPPPPPLSSTMETVPVRLMSGPGHNNYLNLAPSTNSLHSFGSYGY